MNQPSFYFEEECWKKGFRVVAGCDEVGRGSFAGPVVGGCVVFPTNGVLPLASPTAIPPGINSGAPSVGFPGSRHPLSIRIDDSKKLTEKQRDKANIWIKKNALSWGVGEVSATSINKIGIVKATQKAFRMAIGDCNLKLKINNLKLIEFLLIDAFYLPFVKGLRRKNQLAIINGDEKSVSIAAASIIAKVHRDKLMAKLSKKYPKYFWHKNRGYGTRQHSDAILKYGITKYHRKQFLRNL